ncbi:MAG: TIGR00730 family Rossman fold protein [Prevotellaceae bacterium]|nr:TIGR00730 family Rossman fold protein [Prevotellaceae bacterium]
MLKIGIFCSSSDRIAPVYYAQTAALGKWIGAHKHTIIYGGTTNGLMERVAQSVKEWGGRTVGILPRAMFESGLASPEVDELIITEDLTERKNRIVEMADLFIALPGGFGTLDEIFHAVAGGQVGYHDKPLFLFNQNGFYNPVIQQINQIFIEQFTPVEHQKRIFVVDTIEDCIKELFRINENI